MVPPRSAMKVSSRRTRTCVGQVALAENQMVVVALLVWPCNDCASTVEVTSTTSASESA